MNKMETSNLCQEPGKTAVAALPCMDPWVLLTTDSTCNRATHSLNTWDSQQRAEVWMRSPHLMIAWCPWRLPVQWGPKLFAANEWEIVASVRGDLCDPCSGLFLVLWKKRNLSEKSNLEDEGLLAHSFIVGGSQWQELEVPDPIPSSQRRVVTVCTSVLRSYFSPLQFNISYLGNGATHNWGPPTSIKAIKIIGPPQTGPQDNLT